jgi:2-polyprenyl-3-methyl-5-hydroxy-6-metoxy-1,4-benzoquinol methylase
MRSRAGSLESYRSRWKALFAAKTGDLRQELAGELASFLGLSVEETFARIAGAQQRFANEWTDQQIDVNNPDAVVNFYATSEAELYELVEWYAQDTSHHYFVLRCAEILRDCGAKSVLDYGSGIGTTAVAFGSIGVDVTMADVSSRLLDFAAHRVRSRGLTVRAVDTLRDGEVTGTFDAIACFDVLEHVPNPIDKLAQLRQMLNPGGLLFLHAPVGETDERPMHIMHDDVLFRRIRSMGFNAVWDEWDFPAESRPPRMYRRADRASIVNVAYRVRDGVLSGALGDTLSRTLGRVRRMDIA